MSPALVDSRIGTPHFGIALFITSFPALHSVSMAAPGTSGPVGFPCDLQAHRKRPAVPRPRPGKHPAVGGRRAAPGPPRSARDDQGTARPGNAPGRGLDLLRPPL